MARKFRVMSTPSTRHLLTSALALISEGRRQIKYFTSVLEVDICA
jgi:hypothetical protein